METLPPPGSPPGLLCAEPRSTSPALSLHSAARSGTKLVSFLSSTASRGGEGRGGLDAGLVTRAPGTTLGTGSLTSTGLWRGGRGAATGATCQAPGCSSGVKGPPNAPLPSEEPRHSAVENNALFTISREEAPTPGLMQPDRRIVNLSFVRSQTTVTETQPWFRSVPPPSIAPCDRSRRPALPGAAAHCARRRREGQHVGAAALGVSQPRRPPPSTQRCHRRTRGPTSLQSTDCPVSAPG